ncbi:MAG: hypothetical protein LBQ43_00820 [Holosporales bacterium]|jgi:SMC interacting uncharacterized protein involved in chromosome segregation|nr:hypothetical protein [Holosporales bacterium]
MNNIHILTATLLCNVGVALSTQSATMQHVPQNPQQLYQQINTYRIELGRRNQEIQTLNNNIAGLRVFVEDTLAQKYVSDVRVAHMEREISRLQEDLDVMGACFQDVSDQISSRS